MFAEPVIGAGGVHRVPPTYLQGLQELCRRHGALFVADCVIGAFGRLGTWFGVDRFGLRPDMITFAKGVTSGYLPLGGVVVSGRVAEPFWTPREDGGSLWFRHGQTYSGHPTCCAAAMANLDIIESEGLLERGRELEDEITAAFAPLGGADLVGEIRTGIGALGAVAFDPRRAGRPPGPAAAHLRRGQGPRRARAAARRRRGDLAAAGRDPRADRRRRAGHRRGDRRGRREPAVTAVVACGGVDCRGADGGNPIDG